MKEERIKKKKNEVKSTLSHRVMTFNIGAKMNMSKLFTELRHTQREREYRHIDGSTWCSQLIFETLISIIGCEWHKRKTTPSSVDLSQNNNEERKKKMKIQNLNWLFRTHKPLDCYLFYSIYSKKIKKIFMRNTQTTIFFRKSKNSKTYQKQTTF